MLRNVHLANADTTNLEVLLVVDDEGAYLEDSEAPHEEKEADLTPVGSAEDCGFSIQHLGCP